jgi:hypothetical protein
MRKKISIHDIWLVNITMTYHVGEVLIGVMTQKQKG